MSKPYCIDDKPFDAETRIGRQMAQGQVVVTVKSKVSGEHVTLRFKAIKRNEKGTRWERCSWDEAMVVAVTLHYSKQPIARIYPGRGGEVHEQTGNRAWTFAMREAIRAAQGGNANPDAEVTSSDHCGRCLHDLTDPISIERGIGPECFGKITGSKHVQTKIAA